jgi:hypothetical protein
MLPAGFSILPTLAAAPQDDAAGLIAVSFTLIAIGAGVWATAERTKRRKVESQAQQMRAHFAQQMQAAAGDNDPALSAFQRQIAELTVAKLKAEVALLEAQLKAAPVEDRVDASKEAHELMVEKTKLEIDGLRLHNAEARRRMEDWRSED